MDPVPDRSLVARHNIRSGDIDRVGSSRRMLFIHRGLPDRAPL
jgi:hypothetical protein